MRKFEISTDSTCDLFADEIKKYDLYVGHLNYTIEDKTGLKEGVDKFETQEEYVAFYDALRKGAIAKTSVLNLQAHINLFTEMAKKGIKKALHISQGRGLSPTIDNALKAIEIVKETYPDIEYLAMEANTTTVAEGMLVRTAVEMRDAGATAEETLQTLENMKGRIQHFIIVDDLMYLRRGGRIGGAAAVMGTMLKLKPIIEFNKQGKLQVVRKEMGTKKAYKSVVDEIKANFTFDKDHAFPIIVHTDNLAGANAFKDELKQAFGIEPEIRIMGPVIGAHVGPNAVAFTFVSNEQRMYS